MVTRTKACSNSHLFGVFVVITALSTLVLWHKSACSPATAYTSTSLVDEQQPELTDAPPAEKRHDIIDPTHRQEHDVDSWLEPNVTIAAADRFLLAEYGKVGSTFIACQMIGHFYPGQLSTEKLYYRQTVDELDDLGETCGRFRPFYLMHVVPLFQWYLAQQCNINDPNFWVISVTRRYWTRHISAVYEKRKDLLESGCLADTSVESFLACAHKLADQQYAPGQGICKFYDRLAAAVGVDRFHFDHAAKRSVVRKGERGSKFNVLIVRYEDVEDWPEIMADVLPFSLQSLAHLKEMNSPCAKHTTHRSTEDEIVYASVRDALTYSTEEMNKFRECEGWMGEEFYGRQIK